MEVGSSFGCSFTCGLAETGETMKKVAQSHSEYLASAALYLDDVREIVEILEGTAEGVTVEAESYVLERWQELPELRKERIRDLMISSRNPYVSLSLSESSIVLRIRENEPTSRGLFEQIKAVVVRRRHLLARLFPKSLFLWWIVSFVMAYCFLSAVMAKRGDLAALMGLLGLLFAGWIAYAGHHDLKCFGTVVLKERIEAPGFFKRNRDKIALTVGGLLVGAILTEIVRRIVGAWG